MREFKVLERIFAANDALPDLVTIPPGDDMGAVRFGGRELLVAVDQVADGVHVDLATMPLEKVGRKCVTRNLSDVAAMAAEPVAAVVAASLPRDFGEARALELFEAMRRTAEHYRCPLIGGDLAIWDHPLLVSITVFADAAGIAPMRRSGAEPGDAIYVTGQLGNSLASGHHLDFEPRLAVARALAGDAATRPKCMIDLSDGLARDVSHLCRGALIEAAALPLREGADWRAAVGDGEDYELLFTASTDAMPPMIGDVPITRVGTVTDGEERMIHLLDGTTQDLSKMGWEHHT